MDNKALSIFRYYKNPEGHYFPLIPATLKYQNKIFDTDALVDSGATISIFQSDVAKYLGIKIEAGKQIFLGGVGGHIKGFVHKLEIELANKKFICPIVFSYEYFVSFNLLGRLEFFKRFRIIFEEKKNYLKLE
ncbi:aspartyl protease family protein [Candidatus Roizmanbacteria bacterium]|nr:aspartyl protease family protein [Candidatus Roizmanbacteria bacterium]